MENVKSQLNGSILTITIDRPKALNALNKDVLTELKQVIDGIDVNVVRCVIVTGSGDKSFVAGADIAYMQHMSKDEGTEWGRFGNSVLRALELLPVPVIAAVNGFALGGGCELAMACDIRIASENASFGQPEVGLGITAGFGGTQRMGRLIGEGAAKYLLYTAARIKAHEALAMGLVQQVVPAAELMDTAMKMAEMIAGNGPIAVRETKRAIEKGRSLDMDGALEVEAKCFGACFASADQREAMAAMLEKRKPAPFQGK